MPQPAPAPSSTNWPKPGQWTWTDYLRLPDDGQRYEIIEGNLYASPAPTFDHQITLARLFAALHAFLEEHHLGIALMAPFDILLPGVASPTQPDLAVFLEGNTPSAGDKRFEGVPDLLVEVISPGSSRLDQFVKFAAYEKAGVPEYWMVNPKTHSVAVHHLDRERGEYTEIGQWSQGEKVRSIVLDGFEVETSTLFPG